MGKTPYRIKRAEHPAEIEGAVRACAQAWRESYQGLLSEEIIDAREREGAIQRRTMEWAVATQNDVWFWILLDSRDQRVVGMACALPARDANPPEILELVSLHLTDEVKGTGAADRLLEMAVGDMDCYLWVLQGNDRAVAFYRRNGFELDGAERTNPDLAGATELRMVRHAD
ncbi:MULTISPECIES: GNAT family N-acetyltransferase [unclassified Luteococcus]|uniref:GNAT family N-acetyltransferase n=1 Tax=unclassified Luteococcus TaxID=2639923 RepID=UPI00313B62C9